VTPTVPYNQELVTRFTTVIINGTFVDDDIYAIYVVPGDYMPSRKEFNNITSASINNAKKSFRMSIIINGTINQTTLNTLNIFMVDEAGYEVYKSLAVLADLQPPTVITSLIR
jgi:hypothetical protein